MQFARLCIAASAFVTLTAQAALLPAGFPELSIDSPLFSRQFKLTADQNGNFSQDLDFFVRDNGSVNGTLGWLSLKGTTTTLDTLDLHLYTLSGTPGAFKQTGDWVPPFSDTPGTKTYALTLEDLGAQGGAFYRLSMKGHADQSVPKPFYSTLYTVNLSLDPTAPVPEPETWALTGIGLAALLLRRRKTMH